MVAFYPVAFVVLAQATLSDRCVGRGTVRLSSYTQKTGTCFVSSYLAGILQPPQHEPAL